MEVTLSQGTSSSRTLAPPPAAPPPSPPASKRAMYPLLLESRPSTIPLLVTTASSWLPLDEVIPSAALVPAPGRPTLQLPFRYWGGGECRNERPGLVELAPDVMRDWNMLFLPTRLPQLNVGVQYDLPPYRTPQLNKLFQSGINFDSLG